MCVRPGYNSYVLGYLFICMLSRNSLESFLKGLIYVSFFVPLVVVPSSFIFPFIVPKVIAFRSIVLLMMGVYTLLLISNWRLYKPRATPLTIVVLLFIASFTISTFIGVDPYHSFWDNHERMLGLFTILHYAAYFLICTGVCKDWASWRRALQVFLAAGSFVMIAGLIQVIKPTFLLNQGDARVIGTLGNAIYMGGYGLFLMFVAALLFLKEEIRGWKVAYVIMGILGMLGMFFSGTRGSILGLAVALLFILIAYGVTFKDTRVRRGILVVSLVGVVLVGLLYGFRKTSFVSNLPAIGRVVNTSWEDFKDSPRYIAWEIALKGWKEKPLFGWGPNNFYFAFNKYYNPRSLDFGYGETWFDNAHNIIVNTMAVQGTFGIITYLGIFGVAFGTTLSAYRKGRIDRHVFIIGSAFLVAHLVQNVTVFENITSYLYFMFWLAMLNRLSAAPLAADMTAATREVGGGATAFVGFVVVLLIIVFNVQPARANNQSLQALRALGTSPADALPLVQEMYAVNYSPHIDDIRTDISRSVIGILSSNGQGGLDAEKSHEYFLSTYNALKSVLEIHPLDIRIHFMLSQLLQNEALQTKDIRYMQESEDIIKQAITYSTERQQLIYTLSVVDLQLGKNQEAIDELVKAKNSNPRIGESYWRIAFIQKVMGNYAAAVKTINEARAAQVKFSDQDEQLITQIMAPPATTTPSTTSAKAKK